jgi:putative Ca2+/H+ antiporter (TMEM165/GDT1 family)
MTPAAFAGIAVALFMAELTDKDALLLLALATRTRPLKVFLAGAAAFALTTFVIVTAGSYAIAVIPVLWIKLVGGLVMLSYGAWKARGAIGQMAVEEGENRVTEGGGDLKAFLMMVGTLVLLDLAGDATEVLTVVFVAQYSNSLLVFSSAYAGLLSATALETALGKGLGRILTPRRIRYVSMAVFLVLGASIVASSLW